MKPIDEFLRKHDLTRADVSKVSGIGESTLSMANNNTVEKMKIKTAKAIAQATGETTGAVIDALLDIEGNPIIKFIEDHPDLNPNLVKQVEDTMIDTHKVGISLGEVSFNRYFDEGPDNTERATQMLTNLVTFLREKIAEQTN